MISWNCIRSMRSVCSRCRDSSICGAADSFVRPSILRHEKDLVAVSVAQRLSHADLAGATIVVPTVVHEGDASIDGAADESDALLFIGLFADVIAAETDGRYLARRCVRGVR